ncbi:MAG: hypothetical protein EAS52_13035 [Parapedobacter sp.]|nr:MAG: hypothetical protein EAS52_13035 [Parapedobacter sp.]
MTSYLFITISTTPIIETFSEITIKNPDATLDEFYILQVHAIEIFGEKCQLIMHEITKLSRCRS